MLALQDVLPCPVLQDRAGQGEKNFDESFSDQDRAGQDRATGQDRAEKKCPVAISGSNCKSCNNFIIGL